MLTIVSIFIFFVFIILDSGDESGRCGAGGSEREDIVLGKGLEVDQVKFQGVLVKLQFMSWETFLYKEWIKAYPFLLIEFIIYFNLHIRSNKINSFTIF